MTRWSRLAALALLSLPLASASAASPRTETAVLAGGCFWGMEWVFEHVKGVTNVVSGYAGGAAKDANYDAVSSEGTGHAEAVKITYDPRQVSYGKLLEVYFLVAHDPTEVNRQGPDSGPSYRSAIFPQTRRAGALRPRLHREAQFARISGRRPIATRIEHGGFYPAEAYHQGFAREAPDLPLYRHQRPPEAHRAEAKIPGALQRLSQLSG